MNKLKDTSITLASFILSGLLGLYLYFFLIKNGSVDLLGFFNIQYVLILLIAQLGMYGIHYSMLREVSISDDLNKDFNILLNGLFIICFATFITINFLEFIINQTNFVSFLDFEKIKWPIFLLSLNKGIYSFINGKQEFAKLGFVNPLRMGTYLYTVITLNDQGNLYDENLFNIFLNGELLVLAYQIFLCFFIFKTKDLKIKKYGYLSIHLKYSRKAFLTSFLTDINLKVDLIVLSFLLGNSFVGLYSYTSSIGEGFVGILNVSRTVATPKLTSLVKNLESFKDHKLKIFRISNLISLVSAGIILFSFRYLSREISYLNIYNEKAFMSLSIIVIGFSLLSYFFAFEHILLQLNFPNEHSKSLIFLFVTNVLLNIIFIKLFGITGAAIATVVSYFLYFYMINYYLKKKLNIQIMSLH